MAQSDHREKLDSPRQSDRFFAGPVHASCVAFNGRGLLILGAAGSGKSSLALQLIGLGAELVADDRVILQQTDTGITAETPHMIAGLIEARGVGILNAPHLDKVSVDLIVDMDIYETERLPLCHEIRIGEFALPLVRKSDVCHFPVALMLYVSHGRRD